MHPTAGTLAALMQIMGIQDCPQPLLDVVLSATPEQLAGLDQVLSVASRSSRPMPLPSKVLTTRSYWAGDACVNIDDRGYVSISLGTGPIDCSAREIHALIDLGTLLTDPELCDALCQAALTQQRAAK